MPGYLRPAPQVARGQRLYLLELTIEYLAEMVGDDRGNLSDRRPRVGQALDRSHTGLG